MYLDANFFVFINLLHKKGEVAREILKKITEGKRAITSSLALDEVMWVLMKNKLRHEVRRVIEDIYATPNLHVREVPGHIPLRAVDMMEQHNLKPRDAFHVAVMEHFGEREIVTDDADFERVKTISRIPL